MRLVSEQAQRQSHDLGQSRRDLRTAALLSAFPAITGWTEPFR